MISFAKLPLLLFLSLFRVCSIYFKLTKENILSQSALDTGMVNNALASLEIRGYFPI